MALDPEVREVLSNAICGAASWFDIYSRLQEQVPEGEENRYRAFVWAFGYDLISPTDEERRQRESSPHGAFWEFDGRRMPPRLADVPEEEAETWGEAFEQIDDARLRGRVGDLLWCRKQPPAPHERARAACRALVELAADPAWQEMERTDGLLRALEIARELSDEELRETAVALMTQHIRDEAALEDDRPGIPFSLLRALVDLPAPARPPDLREMINLCEERYGADPHQYEAALEFQAAIATEDELQDLRRLQVDRWREVAGQAEGILRMTFLERALEVARTSGLAAEAQQLRSELGLITEEELGLKTVSSEIQVPTEDVDRFVSAFVEPNAWQDSLTAFGVHGPPGRDPAELDREVQRQMKEHPLEFLITKVVVDPDTNVAIFRAADEASHRVAAVAQRRQFAARIWSVFAVDVLRRFEAKYGRPARAELRAFFTNEFIDDSVAERIARAFELWWDGQPDESAHLIAPRLEAILREVARRLGLPIIREPVANKPGGVRSLGDLLYALKGHLAPEKPGWHAYLFHLLADPLGLNLRNVIAHGLRTDVSEEDSALLLHAACFLRLLGPPGSSEQQE